MSVPRKSWDPWGGSHVDPREAEKITAKDAGSMPRESGAQFKRLGGHTNETAMRFLVGNQSWCDTEQKKAIIICGEVLCERSWSTTIERRCEKTLVRIVEDARELNQWHDGQVSHHRRVLRAYEDKTGRPIKVAPLSVHWADDKRKKSHDVSRRKKEGVVVSRRIVKVRKRFAMAAQARPPASISPLARAPLAGGDRAPFYARSISRPSSPEPKMHACSAIPTPRNPTDLLHWHAPTHTNTHKHPSWGWYQP